MLFLSIYRVLQFKIKHWPISCFWCQLFKSLCLSHAKFNFSVSMFLAMLHVRGKPSSSTHMSLGKLGPSLPLSLAVRLLFQKLSYLRFNNSQRWQSWEWVIEANPDKCGYLSSSDQLCAPFIQTLTFWWVISKGKKTLPTANSDIARLCPVSARLLTALSMTPKTRNAPSEFCLFSLGPTFRNVGA